MEDNDDAVVMSLGFFLLELWSQGGAGRFLERNKAHKKLIEKGLCDERGGVLFLTIKGTDMADAVALLVA